MSRENRRYFGALVAAAPALLDRLATSTAREAELSKALKEACNLALGIWDHADKPAAFDRLRAIADRRKP